ncbi:MAG: cold shock domain-containing protein [Bacteroidales bacterium]|nr:cold shock domain-containing protein [Bacteroidales bacterium]
MKDANSSKEYFVHSSGLKDRIRENDEVTFDLQEGKKGLNAVNVRLA